MLQGWRALQCLHFPNCQKYEDIAVRWRDEDITVSSFSLYYIMAQVCIIVWYFSNNNNVHLFDYCCHLRPLDFDLPPSSAIVTISGSISKFAGLKRKQCPQNEHYSYIDVIAICFFAYSRISHANLKLSFL